MRGQGRNTTLALVGCLALALWLGLRRTDAPAVAIPTPALPFAPPIAPVTASEPGPPRQPAVLPAEPDELAIVVRMEGWFEPCSFVERPPLQAFQAALYPDLLVDLPLLPPPPRWVRRMLDGTSLQPAALGQQLLDRPWLAHYAMHQQRRWDTADNQDRYLDARGDPAAEAAWFDSLDHYIAEDPALLQALSSHPDAAARDLMLAAAFQRPGIDPLPIVADRTANPLLRQLAIAHACGRGASATHFAPIDGAPTSLALGLAAAALTAAPTEQTFAAYERAAEACRADPPAYPPGARVGARAGVSEPGGGDGLPRVGGGPRRAAGADVGGGAARCGDRVQLGSVG